MIAGDMNIDLLSPDTNCRNYQGLLKQFNLTQVIKGLTRISKTSASLIDHILISDSELVKCTDILPCHNSDHDGPYVLLNVRLPKYEPRYKLIRNEKSFDQESFVKDVICLPFSVVYGVSDPDEKLRANNVRVRVRVRVRVGQYLIEHI